MNRDLPLLNRALLEELYLNYLRDPTQLSESWRRYFSALQRFSSLTEAKAEVAQAEFQHQLTAFKLLLAYRTLGPLAAHTNPLPWKKVPHIAELDPQFYGLSEKDLDRLVEVPELGGVMPLRTLIERLKAIYCGTVTLEAAHILDRERREWLWHRFENARFHFRLSVEEKRWILKVLLASELLEQELHRRYIGQKRFSLEGSDALLLLLDRLLQKAGGEGVEEVVLGMTHRGRLNVLINLLGVSPKLLFQEMEGGHLDPEAAAGDVRYHRGFSRDITTEGGILHLSLAFNPSHLEIVAPVVCGSVRARQDLFYKENRSKALAMVTHGDAAVSGQGVVMETLQMAGTRAFRTGGTLHIIIDNQIGFTTDDPRDLRTSRQVSDIAKVVEAPILRLSGDDPEAVWFAAELAIEYRQKFQRDVFIHFVGYRRHGHNEADDPTITQPTLYRQIKALPTVSQRYSEKLKAEGVVDEAFVERWRSEYLAAFEKGEVALRPLPENTITLRHRQRWRRYRERSWDEEVRAAVPVDQLRETALRWLELPETFAPHPQVAKLLERRREMALGQRPVDWGFAENLAYATLLAEGKIVRLVGQDVARGTFAHRHAILYDYESGEPFIPLEENIARPNGGRFYIHNSLLSEEGVLAFEYGYSSTDPEPLVIWEAQFGDFANVAQVVIDQFITSGEAKWGRLSGLVLFLPHGYEGQGPEHSSARLERFLQLCAEDNIQVCVPTTPAQLFHLLRRQQLRPYRKPLITLTPKSLLRHRAAVSPLEALSGGRFEVVLDEGEPPKEQVQALAFCCGKIYYELLEARRQKRILNLALIRLEQLYPFPERALAEVIRAYQAAEHFFWVQEEPQNQGAWCFVCERIEKLLPKGKKLCYVGRPREAVPVESYLPLYQQRQRAIVESLFAKTAVSALREVS